MRRRQGGGNVRDVRIQFGVECVSRSKSANRRIGRVLMVHFLGVGLVGEAIDGNMRLRNISIIVLGTTGEQTLMALLPVTALGRTRMG